jgi:hypothetical protein
MWDLTYIPNSSIVVSIGFYATSPITIKVKIALRNSATSFTFVVAQSYSHGGTGWEDCVLTTPYSVAATGNYVIGVYSASGYGNNLAGPRAYVSGDASGTATLTSDDPGVNPVPPLRWTVATPEINTLTMTGFTGASAVDGQIAGGALSFNGTSSYLTTAYTPNQMLYANNVGDFVAWLWIYPTSFAAEKGLFDTLVLGGAGARKDSFVLVQNITTGKLRIFTNSAYSTATTGAVILNRWNFVAIARVAGSLTFFINGVQDISITMNATSLTSGGLTIGRYADSAGGFFAGNMQCIGFSTYFGTDLGIIAQMYQSGLMGRRHFLTNEQNIELPVPFLYRSKSQVRMMFG